MNETTARQKGLLADGPGDGKLVVRGSMIGLYVLRPASQGKDLYVHVERFLAGKDESSKAYHHRRHAWDFRRAAPRTTSAASSPR